MYTHAYHEAAWAPLTHRWWSVACCWSPAGAGSGSSQAEWEKWRLETTAYATGGGGPPARRRHRRRRCCCRVTWALPGAPSVGAAAAAASAAPIAATTEKGGVMRMKESSAMVRIHRKYHKHKRRKHWVLEKIGLNRSCSSSVNKLQSSYLYSRLSFLQLHVSKMF